MRGPGPFKVCGALGEALVRKQARSVCRRAKRVHSSWGSGGRCKPPSGVLEAFAILMISDAEMIILNTIFGSIKRENSIDF